MPVSKPEVIDFIGTDDTTGRVLLIMAEDRNWEDLGAQMRDLESKVNSYIGFVFGGQMKETAEYRDRPVEFELHCRFTPPADAAPVLRALKAHLAKQKITFSVYVGPGRSRPLVI